MSTDLHVDPRCNSVLNAAMAVFARYGFKRVSMEDIALEAGLSRPTLYLVYPNKSAILTALVTAMADRACSTCTDAWPETESFQSGLTKAAIALNLDAWRLVKGSPHGGELIANNSVVVSEISKSVEVHFAGLIKERLLGAGNTGGLAKMIVSGLHGIKDKASSEDELVGHIEAFAAIVTTGLGLGKTG